MTRKLHFPTRLKQLLTFAFLFVATTVNGQWKVETSGGSSGYRNAVRYNSTGDVYVVLQDASNGNKATVQKKNGTSWEIVGTAGFSTYMVYEPSIAVNQANGDLYVAYIENFGGSAYKLSCNKFDGTSWIDVGTPEFMATGPSGKPGITINNNGNPVIVTPGSVGFHVLQFNGNSWDNLTAASTNPTIPTLPIDMVYKAGNRGAEQKNNYFPIVGSDGSIYLAVSSPYIGDDGVMVMKYAGGTWTKMGANMPGGSWTSLQRVTFAPNGDLYVAYAEVRASSNYCKIHVRKWNGSSWVDLTSSGTKIFNSTYNNFNSFSFDIAFDSNSVPFVIYQNTGNDSRAHLKIYNSATSNWDLIQTTNYQGFYLDAGVRLFIDANNNPFYVATNSSEPRVYVADKAPVFRNYTPVSPTTGGEGTAVTINGVNLLNATNVSFNGVSASFTTDATYSPTLDIINTTVPSGATTGTISVTNSFGTTTTSSFTVTPPPTISSFTPTSGAIGSPVVITGTDFTGATAVSFNGTNATSFTVNSATQITARVPAGATTGTIAVTTPSGTGTSSSSITIGGEVLLEYPFNNSLEPSIGTGNATITGTTTILGANSVCTDTDNNSVVRTAAIPLTSFNANAFQFDVDFSLPVLPPTSSTRYLINSSDLGRDFGVKVSSEGRLSVFYKTPSVWEVNSQSTNVQLAINTNYNLSVQFIGNTIRMKLNGTLVLVVDVADGLAVPSNPLFLFGDAFAAALPMRACIDNFRFIKDPLPFSFADQLVISPTAFSSFEACVNRPSAAQTFSVSGTNLSNNSVVIRAPNRIYEISQNGTSFSTNPITLTASAGTLNPTTIHVRVISNPTAAALSPTLDRILNIDVGSSNPLYRKAYILQGNISALPIISGVQNMTVGGNTLQLTGSGTPDATTPWASSNPAVATISSTGVITAVAGGTTTITYTVSNGCSATTTVRVIDCNQPFFNAMSFDGTDDYVTVGDSFENLADVTTEAWVYWRGSINAFSEIFTKDLVSAFAITSTNKLHANFGNGSGWDVGLNSTESIPLNTWTHLAVTRQNGMVKLFINGKQDSATATMSATGPNDSYRAIGAKLFGTTLYSSSAINAKIDEVRFWSTARTQAQIQASMNTELVGTESGLLAYYTFNHGIAGGNNASVNTIVNIVNSASNGTITSSEKNGTTSNLVVGVTADFTISGAAIVCSNTTSQYTHPIAGGTWSISNGATATVSATGLLTTTNNENLILSYSYTLNGCPFTATQSISIGSPSAPTSLVATPGNGQLEINFTEGNNGGSAITNYEYTTNGGTTWTALSPADITSPITIPNLTNGTAYSVSIRALNTLCTSTASASVTATPAMVPSTPTSLVATAGNGEIAISFTPGSNGGSAITNYEYTLNGGTTWTALSPADATSPVTISGLTNGTAYTVSLRAVNAVGTSVASASATATPLPGGPACTTYTNKTISSGLGNNQVRGVFAIGNTVYAATASGLSISTDGGATFTNRTTSNGLGNDLVNGVYAVGSTVYAATAGGLSISTDGGATFTNRTTSNGLGHNNVNGVYVAGSTVYAATLLGLGISTDGGTAFVNRPIASYVLGVYALGSTVYAATTAGLMVSINGGTTFTNRTTTNGLGNNRVNGVFAIGNTVYAATDGGLSISTDGGTSFTNRTTANGLGNDYLNAVYAIGSTVYVATTDGYGGVGGLSISTNGGVSFTNLRTTNGLGSNYIYGVFATANTVYAATGGGVSYCFAPTVPSAPTSLIATPGDGQIGISFTAGNNGGSAITNYEYTINGGTTWTALNPADGSSPVTIASLTNGTQYSIKIRAVNSLGFGAASSAVTATPLPALPIIGFASTTQTAVINRAISITTNNSGGAATFAIAPALPAGVALNSSTGLISGTPTAIMASRSYTVTATNAAGSSSATFSLFIDSDLDGDGIGDATDPDIDGDGVPNSVELQEGTSPTNPYDKKDTDGDGVPDYVELQQGTNPTNPNDAMDTDSDGVPDYVEVQQGTSPTNPGDYKDSDGDGVPDYIEVQQGTNPSNPVDVKDTDGDGIADYIEVQQGTNPNAPGDSLLDTDGDGVPDYIEILQGTNPNAPGDQLIDTDGDGVPNYVEVQQGTDPTNAGDFKDNDGDGVPDFIEVQQGTNPANPNDVKDTDGDGIADFIEEQQGTNPTVPGDQLIDSDGDGVPNYVEIQQGTNPNAPGDQLIDSDGDGVPNYVEIQQGTNPNNPNDARDSDGDGVPNYIEIQQGTNPSNPNDAKDTDGDGIPDYIETQQGTNPTVPGDQLIDSDNDGIPNYIEELQGTNPNTPGDQLIDSDGDGVPNYAEVQQGTNPNNPNDARDSDGDGVPDYIEVQQGTNPSNPNDVRDSDGDGIPDYIEVQQGTNPAVPGDQLIDSDGDGVPNYIEELQGTNPNVPGDELIDSDGDGVPDYAEVQQGTQPGSPGDALDTDGDGVPDYVEIQQGSNPSNPSDSIDTDGDGIPDYIEVQQGTNPNLPGDAKDNDGDGVPDYIEFLQGTNPNAPGDQLIDTDGDGVPDYVEVQQGTNPTVPDNQLIDSDGDGVPDFIELQEGTNPNNLSDFKDDDGDGVSNYEEGYNSQNPAASIDTDGDGTPDYLDADSDGDGILDRNDAFPTNPSEWTDSDGDGIGDKTDLDDDNDGILDACDVDVNGDGIPDNSTDIDSDGTIDSCDTDKDGDGVNNVADNCPDLANANQADRDRDGLGNVCDTIELNTMEGLTPNGDGINDVWIIYNIENHPGSTVRVFNANGTQVFYSANYQNNWTGNYQGSNEMLPIGSYMFQIDLGGDGTIDSQGWMYISK